MEVPSFQELRPNPGESSLTPLSLTSPPQTTNKSCCLSLQSSISPLLTTSYRVYPDPSRHHPSLEFSQRFPKSLIGSFSLFSTQ